VRANAKRTGLINGQVLTAEKIESDGSIVTREGVRIPSGFRQWCHGYVVTTYKSQSRTHEHVVFAAERLDAKSAYVGCSRGKLSCTVHTPDKRRLLERLPDGTRRAALDVLSESANQRREDNDSRIVAARVSGWVRLLPVEARQITKKSNAALRHRVEQIRQRVRLWQRYRPFSGRHRLSPKLATEQRQSERHTIAPKRDQSSVRFRIG